jgi:signal transduction histidine kinase
MLTPQFLPSSITAISILIFSGLFLLIRSSPGFSAAGREVLVPAVVWRGVGSSLTRVRDRPGRTQQTRIFCGKTLLLTSSGARVQEREKEQESKSKREKKQEQEREKARTRERKRMAKPRPF